MRAAHDTIGFVRVAVASVLARAVLRAAASEVAPAARPSARGLGTAVAAIAASSRAPRLRAGLTSLVLACALLATAARGSALPPESSRSGIVVLQSPALELDEATARAIVDGALGPRVVLSIGSKSALDPLAKLGGDVVRFDLDRERPDEADERELAAAIERASVVTFVGTTFLDCYETLTPRRKRSRAASALVRAHERGAVIVCANGAAEFASGFAQLTREELEKPARDPHDPDVELPVAGLGLVEDLCLVAATDVNARLDGIIETLTRFGPRRGALVCGGAAWCIANDGTSIVRGPGAVVVLDTRDARRERGALRGIEALVLVERATVAWSRDVGPARADPDPLAKRIDVRDGAPWSVRDWLERSNQLATRPIGSSFVYLGVDRKNARLTLSSSSIVERTGEPPLVRMRLDVVR